MEQVLGYQNGVLGNLDIAGALEEAVIRAWGAGLCMFFRMRHSFCWRGKSVLGDIGLGLIRP